MSKARILIVEDNHVNRDMYCHMVTAMGHTPSGAADGEAGLELLEKKDFDLVLLDIMMPGMTGLEMLKILRERVDMQTLPVILLSALDSPEDVAKGLSFGANDYMTKPANLKVFQRRVENQLSLKQMSDERAAMLATVQEANDFKNTLMRMASHDLRSPVQSIGLILNLLRDALADDNESMEMLAMARRLANNMEDMITDFLDMELAQDGELTVNCDMVPVLPAVRDVLANLYHTAQEKGVTIHNDVPDVMVYADETRLRQVLNNLVSNAIKYTPPYTPVTISGAPASGMFELHVRDSGKGIAPDEVDKLFQPFGKLSTRPTAGESSTGLGLWIVKSLMEAQHGTVYYNTDYTSGADFCVVFPLVESLPQEKPAV